MTIRFRCSACSQPIEVDDEWATKVVGCPYCRKTVTAPTESSLTELDQIPTAAPMVGDELAPVSQPPPIDMAVNHPNRIAVVALSLAVASAAMFLGCRMILAAHPAEMSALEQTSAGAQDFAAAMKANQKFFEEHPEAMTWLAPAGFLGIGGLMASLAAVVCGIIGVRRVRRRGLAIAALIIGTVPVIFFCCGGFLSP